MINLREIFQSMDSLQYFQNAVGQENMEKLNIFGFDMLILLFCAELTLQRVLGKEESDGLINEETADITLEHITRLINRIERTMTPRQNE